MATGSGYGDDDKKDKNPSKIIDGSSPFFLYPSDNPGAMISSCVLKGDNYDLWQKAMRNALRAKNKLGFIDGKLKQTDAPEDSTWGACNSMLVSWLFNSIDPALQPSIAYAETVKELWDDLKERFAIGNAARVHQLKADIAAARQQGQSVVTYFTRLKSMWDELSNYNKLPVCTCKGCTCDMVRELVKEREDEKTHQFLMGLDDAVFGNVRSNILSMEPLPTLNKVYSLVIQEERHRSVARGKEERGDAVGFTVQASKPGDGLLMNRGWELHQMDVHNAFLHGDLREEVYMRLPPGFASKYPGKVCRLRKSLYGLRQAPRMWFSKLTEALQAYGFTQSYADYSLFTFEKQDTFLAILVYVDDLVVAGNNSEAIVQFKKYLNSTFYMKDLGTLKYFLGIEIARSPTGLYLCQRKYTLDIVAECGLLGARPATFPIEQNHNLSTAAGKPMQDPERYRRLIGRLIYLTITRPDLCYSVHILAQFMHAPLDAHYDAAIRVMRYLKGSPGQGILLCANSDLTLYGYCDSDWATCPLTRRSLTGYFVTLGDSPISWKTKKQPTVSRSSAEAEYRSMATAACELTWLKTLLQSLGVSHIQPMKLMCDSQAALHIAANPVFHERTKHIEIDCHYVRDQIQAGRIVASHIRTNEQLADIFTKALGKRQFHNLLGKLGIHNLHAQLEGECYASDLREKIS